MPLFNEDAPPSDNNDDRHVRGSAFRPYMHPGTSSKEGSIQAQSPTTRLRTISKRMRSENHKHSIGDFVTGDQEPTTSTDRVDATVRAFANAKLPLSVEKRALLVHSESVAKSLLAFAPGCQK